MKLVPKNWSHFQHYKDRCPPWIKFHRDILNDRKFMCLPLASKALAPLLWLLASESKDGAFDADTEELVFRLRISADEITTGLKALIENGFFLDASTMQAPCVQPAPQRQRQSKRQRTETEGENANEILPDPDFGGQKLIDVWKIFVDQRRSSNKPMTVNAANIALKTLRKSFDAGFCPIAMVEKSIMNSWTGIFAAKPGDERLDGAQPAQQRMTHTQATKLAASKSIFGDFSHDQRIIDVTPEKTAGLLGSADF